MTDAYDVYQQKPPRRVGVGGGAVWEPVVEWVGIVRPTAMESPMALARTLPAFARTSRRTLAAFPILQAIDE